MAIVMVVVAAAMTFFININLTNILVSRRMKDIVIMRINGFSLKQARQYLSRETLFITTVGLISGLIVGVPFGSFMVRSMGKAFLAFYDNPFFICWFISIVLNVLFALIVNMVAFKKLAHISLINQS